MSESKAQQVEIREVDGLTLRKLVDYIYTAEIEVTEDNVQVSAGAFCLSVFARSACSLDDKGRVLVSCLCFSGPFVQNKVISEGEISNRCPLVTSQRTGFQNGVF